MRTYWQNLNERERWLVSGTAIILGFYLFYLFLYSPLSAALTQQKTQLLEKKETLAWMQQAALKTNNQNKAQLINSSKLLTIIANQLATNSLKNFPYQLQQTGTNELHLTFEQVPFNPFLLWLWELSKNYGLVIKQLTVEPVTSAGIVKLTLKLEALKD